MWIKPASKLRMKRRAEGSDAFTLTWRNTQKQQVDVNPAMAFTYPAPAFEVLSVRLQKQRQAWV